MNSNGGGESDFGLHHLGRLIRGRRTFARQFVVLRTGLRTQPGDFVITQLMPRLGTIEVPCFA